MPEGHTVHRLAAAFRDGLVRGPVRTSSPNDRRCSAITPAERVSAKPSSGCWWKSRRHATTSGRTRWTAASTLAVST